MAIPAQLPPSEPPPSAVPPSAVPPSEPPPSPVPRLPLLEPLPLELPLPPELPLLELLPPEPLLPLEPLLLNPAPLELEPLELPLLEPVPLEPLLLEPVPLAPVPLLLEPLPLEPPLEPVLPPLPELEPLLLLLPLPGVGPVDELVPHDADEARAETARTANATELRSLDMDIHLPKGRSKPNRGPAWMPNEPAGPPSEKPFGETARRKPGRSMPSSRRQCQHEPFAGLSPHAHAPRQEGEAILYSPGVVG